MAPADGYAGEPQARVTANVKDAILITAVNDGSARALPDNANLTRGDVEVARGIAILPRSWQRDSDCSAGQVYRIRAVACRAIDRA